MNTKKKTPELAGNRGIKGKNSQRNDSIVSGTKQRRDILTHLQRGNRLTTLQARQEFGIMHPAARVMELRAAGWNIVTHYRHDTDTTGAQHKVAEYVLLSGSEVA